MSSTARVSLRFAQHLVLILPLLAAANLSAQGAPMVQVQPANSAPAGTVTGTVTGTVYAQDTRRPIRFAQVQLVSVTSVTNPSGGGRFGGSNFGASGARTEVDGTFTATNVAPGDYYVTASALGYVSERALLTVAAANGADPAQLVAALPTVHVDAGTANSVAVTLQRGGTVGGKLLWEDGSPAAGISITAVNPAAPPGSQISPLILALPQGSFGLSTTTDDRGEFRIAGLPGSDYQIQALLPASRQNGFGAARGGVVSVLRVYAPGVFRKSAAKSYTVRAGDERTDVRIVIDLRSLRTVSGQVNSSDATQNVASGGVTITDASDSSLVLRGTIAADGSFNVRYVPPGNYVLAINGASTRASVGFRGGGTSTEPVVSFQPLSQPIVVTDTDLSGFTASLVPVQAQH